MESSRADDHGVRRTRLEARLEAEAREAAVAEQVASSRGLVEAICALSDGGVVTVEIGECRFAGRVSHAGDDLFILESGSRRVLLVAGAVTGVSVEGARSTATGPRTSGYPASPEALLRRLISQGESAVLGRVAGDPVHGTIVAVARTHVEGRDRWGRPWLVPLSALAWIELTRGESTGV